MTRNDFLLTTCKGLCGAALLGVSATILESCTSLRLYKTASANGIISVPVSEFAETTLLTVRVPQIDYDLLVVKKPDNSYHALLMRCSHQDFTLSANPKGLSCSMHGSTFDLEGNVRTGPATEALRRYSATLDGDKILIRKA